MPAVTAAQFEQMESVAQGVIVGRSEEIHTAIIALVARQHHLQVGPPGVAKSLLASTITKLIGGANVYDLLFTKQTQKEEIFGPISLTKMAEEDILSFNTDGHLPWADIFFGDEIFKASKAILWSLLWALNERSFRTEGQTIKIPLISGFFGSNEFPEDESLDALYDRITFRHWVNDIGDPSDFSKMIRAHMNRKTFDPVIELEALREAQREASEVVIEDDIVKALWDIRSDLKRKGIPVSSRTMANCTNTLQAAAYVRGGETVLEGDLVVLEHVLWREKAQRDDTSTAVTAHAAPILKEASDLRKAIDFLYGEIKESRQDTSMSSRRNKMMPHTEKLDELGDELVALVAKMKAQGIVYPKRAEMKQQLLVCAEEIQNLLVND